MKANIVVEWEENIAYLKMQDEQGKNSLSLMFTKNLINNIQEVSQHPKVKVLVITGLPTIFCSGADFEMLNKIQTGEIKPLDILLPKLLLDIPVPVISAMEGHAVGGGLALGLCSDMVVLAEESRYGFSFMNMGFTPGMGSTKLMEHFVSPAIAHEMLYTGIMRKGRDFKQHSSINYILPKKEVFSKAQMLARAINEKNRSSLVLLKRYLSLSRRKLFEETHTLESMMHELSFYGEGIANKIEENLK